MRHKKSGSQIGEHVVSSVSNPLHFQFQENPSTEIEIPSNFNEKNHHFLKKKTPNSHNTHFIMSPQEKTKFSPKKTPIFCPSSHTLLATKSIALKLIKFSHLKKIFWINAPLRAFRVLILLFLPSLYFFSQNHNTSFYLYILFVIIFCTILSSFHNPNTFNPSSIPSFITRNFPILNLSKSKHATNSCPPVVWQIGSKNRFEQEGTVSGFSVKVYSNRDVYEGEFYKGKCSGSGVYYYNMNGRYEGDWVDQKYDGYGVETWAKGSRYRGQYRQGARHGYGVYRFYTGDMYAGEWFKGQCHGCGVHTCEDGSKYVGEFKGGVKHGLGFYHFRNGDTYAGEYFADKMHGFGAYHFANRHRYEGSWHEGRRQGFGMYTFRNRETQSGHWENGLLSVSSVQHKSFPGSSVSVSHVKVLKAVEEARLIAEKAMMVGGDVEARVNRAVTAANRAANAARVAAVKAVQNRMHQHADTDDLRLPIV